MDEEISKIAEYILSEWKASNIKIRWQNAPIEYQLILYVKVPNQWFRVKVGIKRSHIHAGNYIYYFDIPKWNLSIKSAHAQTIWEAEIKAKRDRKNRILDENKHKLTQKAMEAFGLWQKN